MSFDGSEPSATIEWVSTFLGRVTSKSALSGGWTSEMTAFSTEDGTRAVLRVMDREPWRSFGIDLTRRESDVQHLLENTSVPAQVDRAG